MRRYAIFTVVSLALFLASVNNTTVSVAYPVMVTELNASLVLAGWVLSSYQLVSLTAMPIIGKISEAFGHKLIFMICAVLFTAGSVLCAIAPNIELLIVFRALQAVGGGGFLPCATVIVNEEFPESRQRAIGLFTSIFPIGSIIGPNIGGFLVAALGWKSIFWLNVPIGVAILVLSLFLLRNKKVSGSKSIDILGAGLIITSLFAFMLAISELGDESGVSWVIVVLLFTLSGVGLLAFLRWERRAREPIIDLTLLRGRPFLAANIYNIIYGACAFGIFNLIPLYATSIYNMSVLESGLVLTPRSAGMILASTVTSFYLVRWGYRKPILIGTAIIVVSLFMLALQFPGVSLAGIDLNATQLLLVIMLLSGLGVGISAPAANNACIELMPDKIATITGLRGMFRQMGGAINIAITTLLLQGAGDMSRGFGIALFSLAFILLLSIPAVFIMPDSADIRPVTRKFTVRSRN